MISKVIRRSPTTSYASSACVSRAIKASQSAGITIGSIVLQPNGTIELRASPFPSSAPANDFDRLEAEGLL